MNNTQITMKRDREMKKIAFFCTGGMGPDCPYTPEITYFPRRARDWDACVTDEVSVTFYVVLPGNCVVDAPRGVLTDTPEKVRYVTLPPESDPDEIADRIAADHPDVAVALSVPEIPYDWNQMRDAVIAKKLSAHGIETIAHEPEAAMIAFEKSGMSRLLSHNGFHIARHLLVNANLFFAEQEPGILKNIYREYVEYMLSLFRYPVAIKPDCCAGSVGLSVAKTPEEAIRTISAGEPSVDMLVEEWISGENFGVEIYGVPGKYMVTPPVKFTSSENGVPDPFFIVKYGPVLDGKYRITTLDSEMRRLAELLQLRGVAEVDLVFSHGEWYIIEVNPRYSLLAPMPASMHGKSVFSPLVETALGKVPAMDRAHLKQVVEFKAGMLSDERIEALRERYTFITYIMRFYLAVSETDVEEYCEFVVTGDTKEELRRNIDTLKEKEPDLIADLTYQNIMSLSQVEA